MNIKVKELFPVIPVFSGLNSDALSSLIERVRVFDYSPGDIIISEGTLGDTLYVVAEGAVEVVKNLDLANERVIATLDVKETFREMCIIETVARSASVRALTEPTLLYALHSSDLYRLYKINPEQFAILILNIARDICRRLRQVDERYTVKVV